MKTGRACVLISMLAVLVVGCSKKNEHAPSVQPAVAPAEVPQEMPTAATPTDHRLRLGIDGDPGYAQQELTPEELAAARAAGAAVPQPSSAPQPSEPSHAEQPSESPGEVEDEASGTVYVGGARAPVIRHHIREEAKEGDRREPRPVTLPHEPPRSNAAQRVPRR
ncbi:MAG: hypothetical protein WCB63_06255 [Polyangiales bacterium]